MCVRLRRVRYYFTTAIPLPAMASAIVNTVLNVVVKNVGGAVPSPEYRAPRKPTFLRDSNGA